MGKNDKKNNNKRNNGPGAGLRHQLVNLLNRTSHVSGGSLDTVGHAKTGPILNSILHMGYQQGKGDMTTLPAGMSDNDAISEAIRASREGYGLRQGDPGVIFRDAARFGKGTASGNMLKSLMAERRGMGMSKQEARADIHDELAKENYLLKHADTAVKGSSVDPQVQEALAQRKAAQAGMGANGGDDGSGSTYGNGAGIGGPGSIDPSGMANDQAMSGYMSQGTNDIGQYQQTAALMGGMVPDQLRPLYDLMVQQRAQEMTNNLNLAGAQMQAYPSIQAMRDSARDYRTAARSGSGSAGGLSALLNGSQGGSGGSGQGQAGISSSGGLNGQSLSDQLLNQLDYGKYMGTQFSGFEKPVTSNSQMTYLRDFIPRSNKGWGQVPQIAAYLGATPYGQNQDPYG